MLILRNFFSLLKSCRMDFYYYIVLNTIIPVIPKTGSLFQYVENILFH